MSKLQQLSTVQQSITSYDLFRLSKSKREVDLCSNTIRGYFKEGLPFYRMGKAIFVSRSQLQQFIQMRGAVKPCAA